MSEISVYAELLPILRQVSVVVSLPSPATTMSKTSVTLFRDGRWLGVRHAGRACSLALPCAVQGPAELPLGPLTTAPTPQSQGTQSQGTQSRGTESRGEFQWKLPVASGEHFDVHAFLDASTPVPWEAHYMNGLPTGVASQAFPTPGTPGTSPDSTSPNSTPRTRTPNGAGLACRACSSVVTKPGPSTAVEWKDLPSDNWAEMMEFWHCHKPDHGPNQGSSADHPQHDHDPNLSTRGYGAESALAARCGVGFVDLTAFLLHRDDLHHIDLVPIPDTANPSAKDHHSLDHDHLDQHAMAHCTTCRKILGVWDPIRRAVCLFKWRVSPVFVDGWPGHGPGGGEQTRDVRSTTHSTLLDQDPTWNGPSTHRLPSAQECLLVQLLTILARSGSAKTLVFPLQEQLATPARTPSDTTPVLLVWVLHAHLCYAQTSSSSSSSADPPATAAPPQSAARILYRYVPRSAALAMLDAAVPGAEELAWDAGSLAECVEALDASNGRLPREARHFREWKVGLLRRWGP